MVSFMKAVFLDRDGTVNVEVPNYLTNIQDLEIIEETYEAIRLLKQHGYKVFIATNQACVNKGLLKESELHRIHNKIVELLAEQKAFLDAVYYCPHIPQEGCTCRKPDTGMIKRAQEEHGIHPDKSFFVGDRLFDIRAGKTGGLKTVLVKTGAGAKTLEIIQTEFPNEHPDFVANHILEAAHWIIQSRPSV